MNEYTPYNVKKARIMRREDPVARPDKKPIMFKATTGKPKPPKPKPRPYGGA